MEKKVYVITCQVSVGSNVSFYVDSVWADKEKALEHLEFCSRTCEDEYFKFSISSQPLYVL